MHRPTQIKSHQEMRPDSLQRRIVSILLARGEFGATDDELKPYLPTNASGSRNGRYSELRDAGLLYIQGDTRKGIAGRDQEVRRHISFLKADQRELIAHPKKQKQQTFASAIKWVSHRLEEFTDVSAFKNFLAAELAKHEAQVKS